MKFMLAIVMIIAILVGAIIVELYNWHVPHVVSCMKYGHRLQFMRCYEEPHLEDE